VAAPVATKQRIRLLRDYLQAAGTLFVICVRCFRHLFDAVFERLAAEALPARRSEQCIVADRPSNRRLGQLHARLLLDRLQSELVVVVEESLVAGCFEAVLVVLGGHSAHEKLCFFQRNHIFRLVALVKTFKIMTVSR